MNVETKKIRPIAMELIDRCGSPEAAANYAGLGTSNLYRIVHQERETVQERTARILILALYERRREDRRNGAGPRFMAARRYQALKEERLERLAGY